MANILTNQPICVDTAMTQSFKTATQTSLGKFQYLLIRKLVWEAPSVGGTIVVEDNLANTVWSRNCAVAGDIVEDFEARPVRWADFTVSTIPSGVLWVFLA